MVLFGIYFILSIKCFLETTSFFRPPQYIIDSSGCPRNAICMYWMPNNIQCGPTKPCPEGKTCCAGGFVSCCMNLPSQFSSSPQTSSTASSTIQVTSPPSETQTAASSGSTSESTTSATTAPVTDTTATPATAETTVQTSPTTTLAETAAT